MFELVSHSNVNNKAINEQFQGSKSQRRNSTHLNFYCAVLAFSLSVYRSIDFYLH